MDTATRHCRAITRKGYEGVTNDPVGYTRRSLGLPTWRASKNQRSEFEVSGHCYWEWGGRTRREHEVAEDGARAVKEE